MYKKYYIIIFSLVIICISGCSAKDEIICSKIVYKKDEYCLIPYVEMQANYNNLDDLLITTRGYLSLYSDLTLLVSPYENDYHDPESVNVIEIKVSKVGSSEILKELESLHGKYVQVFGKFEAENETVGEGKNVISHGIRNAHIELYF